MSSAAPAGANRSSQIWVPPLRVGKAVNKQLLGQLAAIEAEIKHFRLHFCGELSTLDSKVSSEIALNEQNQAIVACFSRIRSTLGPDKEGVFSRRPSDDGTRLDCVNCGVTNIAYLSKPLLKPAYKI